MWRGAVILATLWLAACSPFQHHGHHPARSELHQVDGVPFFRQEGPYDCGPAALASLLGHRGHPSSPETIRGQVYLPALRGSLLPDLENYARRQGVTTRSGRGDLVLLRRQIDAGRPVLIPIEMGFGPASSPHYLVVFGYAGGEFLVHAGEQESVFIASGPLLRRWERMNRLYLYLE